VLKSAGQYQQIPNGARMLGIHLEGPFLQKKYQGAQSAQHLRSANPDEYMPWLQSGLVKLITVAPEIDSVMDLIKTGTALGIKFAIGHSMASYDTVLESVKAGLNQATHTFNAMPPLHHRKPGVLGAVLSDDRVYCQVIADGIHLHPAIVKLIFNAKGVERTILITDAIQAAGMLDGKFNLGEEPVTVEDGIARTNTGALAGSTLLLRDALKNSAAFTGLPWQDLLPSATSVPAESLGMKDQIGVLAPGAFADLVIMDDQLNPQLTMVSGQIAFQI
jgi:N-acetylglucosamine-6-phosphate deacetylase